MMRGFLVELRYALRGLARAPGFTAAVIVTLALGIGANTTMFGVLDVLLLRPPAYVERPEEVVRLYYRRAYPGLAGVFTFPSTSVPDFEAIQREGPAFSSVAAFWSTTLGLGRGADARNLRAYLASASYFPMLGVAPWAGRFFAEEDDRREAPGVVVLGNAFWRAQFGGDRSVLGRTLALGRVTYTIVGIAPPGFTGVELTEPDVWLPFRVAGADLIDSGAFTSRGWTWIEVLARLRPGVSRPGAARLATEALRRGPIATDRPDSTAVVLGALQRARGPGLSDNAKVALWVGGVATIVLLVACANVASLLLARGVRRRRELAVRAGLGAGQGRLLRMLLAESVVLALAGGAAGVLLATWGGALVRAFLLPSLPEHVAVFAPRVLLFTFVVALVAGVIAGAVPALQSSRADIAGALRSGGRDVGAVRGRLRGALLAAQVGLTLVLLVGAGLFIRSLRIAQGLDYGMDLEHVLVAGVDLQSVGLGPRASDEAYLRLLARAQGHPQVIHAAAVVGTPYGWTHATGVKVAGRDSLPSVPGGGPYYSAVTPDYFAATGIHIVRGRGFSEADGEGASRVAVINQRFASLVWPGADPIGQCLYVDGNDSTCVQIVGVAADARTHGALTSESGGVPVAYYLPFAQRIVTPRLNGLILRTRGPAKRVAASVQRALQGEPGLPFIEVEPLLDRIAPLWRSWRLGAAMFTAFGLLALAIAVTGLYGVTAYGVSQRTQEIGVRMALGARQPEVIRMVVGQGLRAAAVGTALGAVGALALGGALSALLYQVEPTDPLVFTAAVATLLAVTVAASFVPARRAARVDPMTALRTE